MEGSRAWLSKFYNYRHRSFFAHACDDRSFVYQVFQPLFSQVASRKRFMGSCHRNCYNVDCGYFGNFRDNDFIFESEESNMKKFNLLILSVSILMIPLTSAYAVFPEMEAVLVGDRAIETQVQVQEGGQWEPVKIQWLMTNPLMNITIPGSLMGNPTVKTLAAKNELHQNVIQGDSQILEDLKDKEIAIPQEKSFWSKRKVLLGLLLMGVMFGTLLALFSGSKGGSGTGSGGPGGGSGGGSPGEARDPSGPEGGPEVFPTPVCPPDCVTTTHNPNSNLPTDLPVNPEPSTFLLMSAGFALVFLRRKKA